ncbi:MAG: carboxymuconolactone decarboxylase family protein [Candidatus Acidiferrales bacterium]
MPLFPSLPDDATTKHVFTAYPEIYAHFTRASEAIMRGPSPLSPAERELIGAFVSALNSCQYCYGGHRAAAELFGVAPRSSMI